MSWERPFGDPVEVPGGRVLHTLRDAGEYIQALPKASQKASEWHTATEALLLAAEGKGPVMHARIGMLQALNKGQPKPALRPVKDDPRWGRRTLARDR